MAYRKEESEEEYESELVELHEGIVNDDTKLLKQVLQAGVDVNQKFSEDVDQQHIDMTPLSLAAALNKVDAVKLLLGHNANVDDTFAALKTTALMTSSFHGHSEIVKLLIKKHSNVNAVDVQGSTALGYAFGGTKNFDVISQLLKAGIDVNLKNMLGMNALLLVSGYSNDTLVKMILDAGADANSVNDFNHSALHIVVVGKWSQIRGITGFGKMNSANYGLHRRNLDILLKDWAKSHRHLLKSGREDERLLESIGQFMMEISSRYVEPEFKPDGEDDQETMKKRVEAVWSYRQDKVNETKTKKSGGVIDNLLSCGGKRNKKTKKGESGSRPLNVIDQRPNVPADSEKEILDISEKCAKILKYILDAGCETDKVEKTFGMTALDMAILFGDVESTAVLACAGGDPFHLLKMFSLTELQDAIISVNKKRVKEILASDPHIDVNQKFSSFNMIGRQEGNKKDLKTDGLTPIAVAAQLSDVEILDIIKMLQKQGGDINGVGSSGSTPLAEACRVGNLKMVEFLVSQGASVELPSPSYDNATPVTVAASHRNYQIVDFLIQNKQAKLDKKMSNGKTALILASENDDKMMVERILSANLLDNYSDRNGFTYEMAKEFQRPDKNYTLIQRLITEETSKFREDNNNKNPQSDITRPNNYKSQAVENVRVSGPINVGANQKKPQYNFKPAIPHQEESDEEDEDEEEDEEEETPPRRLPQQRIAPAQIQQKQKVQQKSESEESEEEEDEDEEDDDDVKTGHKQTNVKQVITTRQVTKVIPKKEESSEEEEESEDESEEELPKNIPQRAAASTAPNKVLSAAAVAQASKQSAIQQRVPQARPTQQLAKPQRPVSESEESDESEEEVPKKQVNGNALKGKEVTATQKSAPTHAKQIQQRPQQVSESEEEDEDDEEEEEEEKSYTVQQKVILPSQKIEGRYTTNKTIEKQQFPPSKRLIETHRLSPVTLPPPLPATSPPQEDDDDDDDDIEYEDDDDDDVDEEGYGEEFPARITNLTSSPIKESKTVVTKSSQGSNSRTVVTRTVVTTNTSHKHRVPIPVDSDEDDDDIDEEYDDDEYPAHGTETDI